MGESTAVLSSPHQETWPFELSYDNRELGMLMTQQASIVRAHKSPKKNRNEQQQYPATQLAGTGSCDFMFPHGQPPTYYGLVGSGKTLETRFTCNVPGPHITGQQVAATTSVVNCEQQSHDLTLRSSSSNSRQHDRHWPEWKDFR